MRSAPTACSTMPIPCTIERHGSRPGRISGCRFSSNSSVSVGGPDSKADSTDASAGGAAFVRGHQELTILR